MQFCLSFLILRFYKQKQVALQRSRNTPAATTAANTCDFTSTNANNTNTTYCYYKYYWYCYYHYLTFYQFFFHLTLKKKHETSLLPTFPLFLSFLFSSGWKKWNHCYYYKISGCGEILNYYRLRQIGLISLQRDLKSETCQEISDYKFHCLVPLSLHVVLFLTRLVVSLFHTIFGRVATNEL